MTWTTEGVRAKLDRFRANLKSLDDETNAYLANHPYTFSPEFEEETGWHRILIRVHPPPLALSAIIGDAAHNLRSALDHLAWQLANLDGPPAKPKSVQYPIFAKAPKDFFAHRFVNGMRDRHKDVIERLQPYHAGHGKTALEALAWISNTDKHRLLHTVGVAGKEFVPHFLKARDGYAIERSDFGYSGLLEPGTEVGRLLVTPRNPDLQVDMQGAPSVAIAFGDRGSPVYGTLIEGMLKVIEEAVENMVVLFDRPGADGLPPWP